MQNFQISCRNWKHVDSAQLHYCTVYYQFDVLR